MQLSQGSLNLLATCPRKFQHVYLDQLSVPVPPDQQERLTWGTWFHLLMQRRELGLETDLNIVPLSPLEQRLQQSVDRFAQAVPDLFQSPSFQSHPSQFRQSEHRRTRSFQGHILVVVYDLLILEAEQAQILDWKTYSRPSQAEKLAQNWQTRLYPFVLAETSEYEPEQIAMTYWFIHPTDPAPPQSIRFQYNLALHQQTQADLADLLSQLDRWIEQYEIGNPFPRVSVADGHCDSCIFGGRCHRRQPVTDSDAVPNWSEIEEIAL